MSSISPPFNSPKMNTRIATGVTTRSASRGERKRHKQRRSGTDRPQRKKTQTTTTTTTVPELTPPNRLQQLLEKGRSTSQPTKSPAASKGREATSPSPLPSKSSSRRRSSRINRLPLSPLGMAMVNTRSNRGGNSRSSKKKKNGSQLPGNQQIDIRMKENSCGQSERNVHDMKLSSTFLFSSPELKNNQQLSEKVPGNEIEKESYGATHAPASSSEAVRSKKSPLSIRCDENNLPCLSHREVSNECFSSGGKILDDTVYASVDCADNRGEKEMTSRRLQFTNTKPTIEIFSPPLTAVVEGSQKSPILVKSSSDSIVSNGTATDKGTVHVSINRSNDNIEMKTMEHNSLRCRSTRPNKKRKHFQFNYPQDLPPPTSEHIRITYEEVMKISNPIDIDDGDAKMMTQSKISRQSYHQKKLKMAGSDQVSFEEVVLPCVTQRQKEMLVKIQGKAQGYDDQDAKEQILLCRATLKAIERDATFAVKVCREDHEEEVRKQRKKEEERFRVAKQERENDRIARRAKRTEEKRQKEEEKRKKEDERKQLEKVKMEKRRRDRKKNFPKNKELWREVALLMTDLGSLEKEKMMWKEAGATLDEMERRSQRNISKVDNEVNKHKDDDGIDSLGDKSESVSLKEEHENVVNDMTVSANRINDKLREVLTLVEKSDSKRKALYQKYKTDHKFQGYLGIKNPKALIRALAL